MDARRLTEELISRCVALAIYHQHARKIRPTRAETIAEIRAVAAEARKAGLSWAAISAGALSELEVRYDPKTARHLHGEIIAMLDDGPLVGLVRA
jgi:hypothetical protein